MLNSIRFTGSLVLFVVSGLPLAGAQTPVHVASVKSQQMQARHKVTGSLQAVARGNLAALEPGRLVELSVREGEQVVQGEVVARIDARRLQAQKAEAEAELEVARAELDSQRAIAKRAAADLARTSQLIRQSAISQQEVDAVEAEALVAKANVLSSQRRIERLNQSLRLIEVRLSDTEIRAPYDAQVVQRHVELGDWVQAGESLLTLISTGPIEAWLDVPERYIGDLAAFGEQVVVRSRATNQDAKVLSVRRVADVNRRVRTLSLVVTIENSDGLLVPGMSVDGWIALSARNPQITVPRDAIIRSGAEAYVFRLGRDGTAERVPVEILFEATEGVAIGNSLLQPQDSIIVEGNERLIPGQQVRVASDRPTIVANQ